MSVALDPEILRRAGVSEDLISALGGITYEQVHQAAAQLGVTQITDLLDTLPAFQPTSDWKAWRSFLNATFGQPLDAEELAIFQRCTGRDKAPKEQAREAWMVVGRRGGKGRVSSLAATYIATCRDYRKYLAPGQRGLVPVIAATRDQAGEIINYLKGIFSTPQLHDLLDSEPTGNVVRLKNRVDIRVTAASYRTVRSYTMVGAVLDEVAFWRNEESSLNPDKEILDALRPAMATIPSALLLGLSSPYARRGVLWETYRAHWGRDGDILVWKADTLTMHPHSPALRAEVERAYRDDPIAADAEYGAEFRTDVAALFTEEVIDAAMEGCPAERPPEKGIRYVAFADPSGGASDSFALGIAHWDEKLEVSVLDCLREAPAPFEPLTVVKDMAETLRTYRLNRCYGDRYSVEWMRDAFARAIPEWRIQYVFSDEPASEIYRGSLPLIRGGAKLLNDSKLKAQLLNLDRNVTRGALAREVIDHPRGSHDDLANVAAGALVQAAKLKWKKGAVEPEPPKDLKELHRRKMAKLMEWKPQDDWKPNPYMR